MKEKFVIINPITFPVWDELLLSKKNHCPFLSSFWAKVICNTYGYSPHYFTKFSVNNEIESLIPFMEIKSPLTGTRAVSLPFTDYCHPLLEEKIEGRPVLEEIVTYGERMGWKYVELRGGEEWFGNNPVFASHYRHVISLSNHHEMWSSFRESTRRNINKAVSAGLVVEICDSLAAVREFYRLNCLTRKQHGLPPQPASFFDNLFQHVLAKKHGVVLLVSHRGVNIAGAVYLRWGDRTIYKYGASDPAFRNLRANYLAMWEAMKHHSDAGYASLCLGRTEPENIGLRQYKTGWGAKESVINYYRYDLKKRAFIANHDQKPDRYKELLSKLPIPVLKTLGTVLYKHVG